MPAFLQNQFFYIRNAILGDAAYYALSGSYYWRRVKIPRGYPPHVDNEKVLLQHNVIGFDVEVSGQWRRHNLNLGSEDVGQRIMGLMQVQVLPDGSFTSLPPQLVRELGEPLHIPTMPASLTYTPKENFPLGMRSEDRTYADWVDRRGSISCIGSNYREWVSSQGSRKAITCRGYRLTQEKRFPARYSIKYVPGSIATRAGNYFLYSQDLNIWNPYIQEYQTVKWVGLASCMSIQYLHRHEYTPNHIQFIRSLVQAPSALSPFQVLNPEGPSGNNWTQEDWDEMAKQDMSQYASPSCPHILETLMKVEALMSTPQGIKLQRMEEMATVKQEELEQLEQQLTEAANLIEIHEQRILKALESIKQLRLQIQHEEEKIPAQLEIKNKLSPQVDIRKRMYAKIQQGVKKKQTEFELIKNRHLEESSGNEGATYAEGLAKSGLVIDELWYRNKQSGLEVRASESPDITVHRDWKLFKMEAHTTRPIKMHFGLDEAGLPPRASGPHALTAYLVYSAPRLQISALVPWAAVGWHEEGFKPYPHVSRYGINTDVSGAAIGEAITSYAPEVCMGQLSATASMAFNNNNPKMLALAILSFLQSVNPTDEWGKSYEDFPLWEDIENARAAGEYKDWLENCTVAKPKYYTTKEGDHFLEVSKRGSYCSARWGDIQAIDGVATEVTSKFSRSYFTHRYDDPVFLQKWEPRWMLNPFQVKPVQHHQAQPIWQPNEEPAHRKDFFDPMPF